MTNHHFYEQSASSWHHEWADDGPDNDEMSEEEREEAENEARVEIERAIDEEAWYRKQKREGTHLTRLSRVATFDRDAPF